MIQDPIHEPQEMVIHYDVYMVIKIHTLYVSIVNPIENPWIEMVKTCMYFHRCFMSFPHFPADIHGEFHSVWVPSPGHSSEAQRHSCVHTQHRGLQEPGKYRGNYNIIMYIYIYMCIYIYICICTDHVYTYV